MEAKTTMLFERVEAIADSGGAGRWRGGVGLRRDIRFLGPGELITVAKKTRSRPWALEGGREPEPNTMIAYPDTPREHRLSTRRVPVEAGDRFRVLSAGGGGRGEPHRREPERVREDVFDGFVTPEAARQIYGVDPVTWERVPTEEGAE
jgi:N-methylhydantoinase B